MLQSQSADSAASNVASVLVSVQNFTLPSYAQEFQSKFGVSIRSLQLHWPQHSWWPRMLNEGDTTCQFFIHCFTNQMSVFKWCVKQSCACYKIIIQDYQLFKNCFHVDIAQYLRQAGLSTFMCSQMEICNLYIFQGPRSALFLHLEFETLKLTRTQCEYIRVNARVCVSKQTCVSAHTAGYLKIDQSVQHHLHIHSWAFKHWSMYGTSHFQMQSWEWDTHYTTNWYKNTPLVNLYNSSSDIGTGAFASESDWPHFWTSTCPN